MTNDELGKALLDKNKQANELFGSADMKRALREINEVNKLVGPNEVQKALADLNKTIASSRGYTELPSYKKLFDQARSAVAELNEQLLEMRYAPTQFISPASISVEDEIIILKTKLKEKDAKIESLIKVGKLSSEYIGKLERRNSIGYLLQRVHEKTYHYLIPEINGAIEKSVPKSTNAFLISLDIRGSTDLMLNAKSADEFAIFLDVLSSELANIVKEHFGIFDKFTGDGALAFFPDYFSGGSASLNVLLVAEKAHAFFEAHYKAFRNSFDVLVETGLGIGIDYGVVNILRLSDGLTAVGKPVVYACRFGAAEAGTTLVNQGAYNKMIAADAALEFDEVPTSIKNQERKFRAYRPKNSPRSELIKEPEWYSASPTPTE